MVLVLSGLYTWHRVCYTGGMEQRLKKCNKCGKEKLYSAFRQRGDSGYFESRCIKCSQESRTNHRREMNALGYDYERKYGITIKQYNEMVEQQSGKCVICKKIPDYINRNGIKSSKLLVDHDKSTKRVRGLLCFHCNTGIGQLCHSIDLLEAAIKYLRKEEF